MSAKSFIASLTPAERHTFKGLGFAAVFVEAYAERVPRRFGDNRGVWPTRIRTTTHEPAKSVQAADYHDGVHDRQLVFCYWCAGAPLAKRIAERAQIILAENAEQIRHAWHDAVPHGVDQLVQWAAMAEGIELWTEDEVRAAVRGAREREITKAVGALR